MATPTTELLLADDDVSVRDMLARAFRADFKVLAAADGLEALALLERGRPGAILIDEMMPGASGTEVLRRAKELYPDVPRVLMTASHDAASAARAINDGEIHRFYTKPLKLTEVRRALLELVERSRAEELLKVELRTLRNLQTPAKPSPAKVLILGEGEVAETLILAAAVRGFVCSRASQFADMEALILQGGADVAAVVRSRDPARDADVRTLARLAQSVDEATAVILLDDDARLDGAALAFELGAADYLAPPLPEPVALSWRLERSASRPRAQRDLRRMTLDLVLANRELHLARRRVEDGQIKLLNGLVRALEARDSYTAGHTDRVSEISVRCGQAMGMKPGALEVIRLGALLHDVGKIGVRDAVLLKPDRLTVEEFEIIKTHTVIGAQLLEGIEHLACALPMVRNHHERLDGTGYPDGLTAEQIPTEVRIVSSSDVLDALTSTRPYRRGSTADEAFEIMLSMEGRHLDPMVLGALRQVHKDGRLVELLQPDADKAPGPPPYR